MTIVSEAQKLHSGFLIESSRAILGESQMFKLIITALLTDRQVLRESVLAVARLMTKTYPEFLNLNFKLVHFTPGVFPRR